MMIETERRNRIRASLFAYAYEVMDDSLVSDAEYDALCLKINPEIKTGHEILDNFFATEFSPDTGMWIYKHPEANGIAAIYQRITGKPAKPVSPYKNEAAPITQNVNPMGFQRHTDMMWYLASLGFRVVPHMADYGGVMCNVEFDTECAYVTAVATGEQKAVYYRDIFTSLHPS